METITVPIKSAILHPPTSKGNIFLCNAIQRKAALHVNIYENQSACYQEGKLCLFQYLNAILRRAY